MGAQRNCGDGGFRELGLEHQVIINKGAVMALPPRIEQAAGPVAALGEFRLSRHNAVGIGDAADDHAFLASASARRRGQRTAHRSGRPCASWAEGSSG